LFVWVVGSGEAHLLLQVVVAPIASLRVKSPNREDVLVTSAVARHPGIEAAGRPLEAKNPYLGRRDT
jgi:hypothetical protein